MVPTQSAYIVERFGRFHKILEPGIWTLSSENVDSALTDSIGLNFNIPLVDRIAYVQSLKEIPIEIVPQMAITSDNVGIRKGLILHADPTSSNVPHRH